MQVNEAGSHIVAAESGDLLYWDMETRKVVHQEKQENIQQIFYYKNQSRCVVVSKKGSKGNESGLCVSRCVPEETGIRFKTFVSRSVPEGTKQWEFEFPFVTFIKVRENQLIRYFQGRDDIRVGAKLNVFPRS